VDREISFARFHMHKKNTMDFQLCYAISEMDICKVGWKDVDIKKHLL